MKIFAATFAVLALSGCALFEKSAERIADRAASGVNAYCEQVRADVRAEIRDRVNRKAAPNTITITCGE